MAGASAQDSIGLDVLSKIKPQALISLCRSLPVPTVPDTKHVYNTTDSHGADSGSFQVLLEGPGAEKLAKHTYKRDNEA